MVTTWYRLRKDLKPKGPELYSGPIQPNKKNINDEIKIEKL